MTYFIDEHDNTIMFSWKETHLGLTEHVSLEFDLRLYSVSENSLMLI